MKRIYAISFLIVEIAASLVIFLAEYSLSTWKIVSPEHVLQDPDARYLISLWVWLAAVSLGVLIGLLISVIIQIIELVLGQGVNIFWSSGKIYISLFLVPVSAIIYVFGSRPFPWLS